MWVSSTARGLLLLACTVATAAAADHANDDSGRPAAGALDGRRRLNKKQKQKLAATADGRMNAAVGRFGAIADAANKKTKQEMRQEARAEKQEEGVNERKQKKKRKRKKQGSGKSGKATHAPSVPATHAPTRGKSGKEGTLSPTVHVTKAPKGAKSEKESTSFPTVSSSEFPTISSPTTRAPTRDPTSKPTALPTSGPSPAPSPSPTRKPVVGPTPPPTLSPTNEPSSSPTKDPTPAPTPKPTDAPTSAPSSSPTLKPVVGPTPPPTGNPSSSPTKSPTPAPSPEPTTMQPTTSAPSSSPTLKPVIEPTSPPTPAPTPEPTEVELSCPDTLDRFIIEPEAILHYAVVQPDPAGASNGIFCGRLEVTGLKGWLGFAISEDRQMAGSTAVIGEFAKDSVLKYDLKQGQVELAPEERQTLRDTSISQDDGRTVMSFTKHLVENGDVPIVLGANIFLHARGDGALGPHGPNKWIFDVNLGETASPTPKPTSLPTASPSKSPSVSPTYIPSSYLPTFYPTSATIAPTAVPDGATYFNGFEKGFLADYDEWMTSGDTDDNWRVSIRNAASGKYSVRAPDLGNNNTEKTPGNSTLTFTADASWGAGKLHFSILGGAQMPIDIVYFFVDGDPRGIGGVQWLGKTEFEVEEVILPPGAVVKWVYKYNPIPVLPETFPPDGADKRAGLFLDDVYFVPLVPPPSPTPSPGPTTVAPTSVPDGATYFIDFEQGSYPDLGLDREDDGEGWYISNEKSETGVFSLRSPDLYNEEGVSVSANFTFSTGPDWPAGIIHWSELAGTRMPLDAVTFYVDGNQRGPQRQGMATFEETSTGLSPGSHEITFEYRFNPTDAPAVGLPPPEFSGRTAYFVDRIYFVPISADATNPAPSPDSTDTEMPTYWPTFSPTLAPTEADMMMP